MVAATIAGDIGKRAFDVRIRIKTNPTGRDVTAIFLEDGGVPHEKILRILSEYGVIVSVTEIDIERARMLVIEHGKSEE